MAEECKTWDSFAPKKKNKRVVNPPPEEKAPETIVAVPVEPKVEVTSDNKPQETSVQVSDENLDKKEGLEVSVTKPEESGDAADGAKGLCISLLAICVSIPALIGAWCWPALLIGIISGTVTAAARKAGHIISIAIMSVLLTAVWIFFFVNTMKRKSGTHFQRCGPMYMLTAAVPLILADNLRHILQDRNIWNACDRRDGIIWDSRRCLWASNQYECTLPGPDHCLPDKDEKMSHLSFVGVLFTVVFMYSGFVCLIGSILWYVRVDKKVVIIKDKCKQVYALYQKNKEKKARLAEQKAEKDSGSKELLNPLVSKSEINN